MLLSVSVIKPGAVLFAFVFRHQKSCSVIRRLGQAGSAQTDVCRDGLPYSRQRHGFGHDKMAGKKIIAALRRDGSPARQCGRVHGFLKRGRVVRFAIAFGAIIAHGINIS